MALIMKRKIRVNGRVHEIEAEENMPLLYVIRDLLSLKGTKYSCGNGICGNCMVLIDHQPVTSCQLPLASVNDEQDIFTVEGLSNENLLSELQALWLKYSVAQCGYCQSGQLLSAFALSKRNKQPNQDEVDEVMSKVLCRCGSYPEMKQALSEFFQLKHNDKVS